MTKLFLPLLILSVLCSQLTKPKLYHMVYEGSIGPISLQLFQSAIKAAEDNQAQCLIIEMDTPGGLMKSMNMMIKDIMSSEVPVVLYVSPSGSHCGSAGVFLMMAAHINAMAPATNIGAAHPVNMGAKSDSNSTVMMEKITNDAVSYIRSISEKTGRNPDWAEDAVRNSVSITETQALDSNVVDYVVENLDSLIAAIDGKSVETVTGIKTLNLHNVEIIEIDRSWKMEFLGILVDPNIAYILMMIGMYGIFFELYNPGSIVPGVVGAISLILAFFAFQSLPVNYAGMLLIVLGAILFIMEIKITSYGLLSVAGSICIILGSIFLIDSPNEIVQISFTVMIPIILITILFFSSILYFGLKAQKSRIQSGTDSFIGMEAVVIEKIDQSGMGKVSINGEIWQAISSTTIAINEVVLIDSINSLKLIVTKKT